MQNFKVHSWWNCSWDRMSFERMTNNLIVRLPYFDLFYSHLQQSLNLFDVNYEIVPDSVGVCFLKSTPYLEKIWPDNTTEHVTLAYSSWVCTARCKLERAACLCDGSHRYNLAVHYMLTNPLPPPPPTHPKCHYAPKFCAHHSSFMRQIPNHFIRRLFIVYKGCLAVSTVLNN